MASRNCRRAGCIDPLLPMDRGTAGGSVPWRCLSLERAAVGDFHPIVAGVPVGLAELRVPALCGTGSRTSGDYSVGGDGSFPAVGSYEELSSALEFQSSALVQ